MKSPDPDYVASLLEHADAGILVLEGTSTIIYANRVACRLLRLSGEMLAAETSDILAPLVEQAWATGGPSVVTWRSVELSLRISGRSMYVDGPLTVFEIHVQGGADAEDPEKTLASAFQLLPSEAHLLKLLWRGLSNAQMGRALEVPPGTVKSRLFRLYQKLGVVSRAMAVLRAVDVVGASPRDWKADA